MLSRLTPHATAAADQPVFTAETRHLPWGENGNILVTVSLRRITRTVTVLAITWAIVAAIVVVVSPSAYRVVNLEQMTLVGAWVLVLAGLAGGLIIDFTSITAALDGISGDVVSGRWDLLRMANVRPGHFAVAKHAIAQVRAWRRMVDVIAVRIAAGLLVLILGFFSATGAFPGFETFFFYVLIEIFLVAVGIVFALEAVWRMRLMTAVGLMVSAYTRHPMGSPLAAFGVTFAMWVMQAAIVGAVGCGMIGLIFPFLIFGSELCMLPLMAAGMAIGLYAFYEIFKQFCLRRVAFRLASLESDS